MKKLSIIIPYYNSKNFIINTIKSLELQTRKDFKVIFIDDGSIDGTKEVIDHYLENKFLDYTIINQKNSGVAIARSEGIRRCETPYFCFLDSDDTLYPTFIEKMLQKIETESLDLVLCGFNRVKNNKIIKEYTYYYQYFENTINGLDMMRLMLRERTWICIGNAIYKTQIAKNNSLFQCYQCHNGEDQEFILKYLIHTKKVGCVQEELMSYYETEGSFTQTISMKKFTVLGAIKRLIKYCEQMNVDEDIVYFLKNNKYQKEFVRNLLSMISIAHKDETLKKIIYNEKFNENIKKFKLIRMKNGGNFSIREIAFYIKLKLYIINPRFFNNKLNNRHKEVIYDD